MSEYVGYSVCRVFSDSVHTVEFYELMAAREFYTKSFTTPELVNVSLIAYSTLVGAIVLECHAP
jgi:hypothetical protein